MRSTPQMTEGPGSSPSLPAADLVATDTRDDTESNTNAGVRNRSHADAIRAVRERLANTRGYQMRARAREVMHAILDACDESGDLECCPSVPDLAANVRACDRTVQRALRDLERAGWISTRLRPIGPKLNDTNLYLPLPKGGMLDLPTALRSPATKRVRPPVSPPSSTVTAEAPFYFQSGSGHSGLSDPVSPPAGEAPRAGVTRSRYADELLEYVRREREASDRELDMLFPLVAGGAPGLKEGAAPTGSAERELAGTEETATAASSSPGEVSISNEGREADGDRALPASRPGSQRSECSEGGTPEGGAVAPSGEINLSGCDRADARGRMPLRYLDSRDQVLLMLLEHRGGELAVAGFEHRIVALAAAEQVSHSLVREALRGVLWRRHAAIEDGAPSAAQWGAYDPAAARPYVYVSLRNDVRKLKEARERERACREKNRLQMFEMEERSLGDAGRQVLEALRSHDVLAGAATVEMAHRLAQRSVEAGTGGKLRLEDVLFVVREVAENERDKVAVGQPRAPGHLASALRALVDRVVPGVARGRRAQKYDRERSARSAPREVQSGGVVDETNEW